MAFPETTLERKVELYLGGAWTDVSSSVYQRDPIVCTEGATAERTQTTHSRMSFTGDNRDDRWNPRNVDGPWWGLLTRNTQARCSVLLGERHLTMTADTVDCIVAPDTAGLSVTGDLDLRLDVTLDDWRATKDLAGKYGTEPSQSWYLRLLSTGQLFFTWTPTGASGALVSATSVIGVPWPHTGRCTLRVTLDVNDGAGGHVVTFYVSTTPGVDGPWWQLGDAVVGTGVTSIFDGTSSVKVGAASLGGGAQGAGRVHAAQIRNGIDGTVVASPTLATQTEGAASFADGQGNTWTVNGAGATITNRRYQHAGELAELPPGQDVSGRDRYVNLVSTGVLRRLGQGASPLQSTMRRALPTIGTHLRAYWPLEDGSRATVAASGIPGRPPMRFGDPAPAWQSSDAFGGSAALPTLDGSKPRGTIASYTSTGVLQVRCLLLLPPAGGVANGTPLWRLTCGGSSAVQVDCTYGTTSSGRVELKAFDSSGAQLGATAAGIGGLDGLAVYLDIELVNNGGNIDITTVIVEPGESIGAVATNSIAGATVGAARAMTLNPTGALTDTVMGHVTVESAVTSVFTFGRPVGGYAYERAGRRVERLCSENGIEFVPHGDLDDTEVMGPQRPDTLVALLRECETTDGGTLFEPRDRVGIAYKPLTSFYTPGTRVVLDGGGGAGGDLADIRPVDDDQLTRNDWTVQRPDGATARAERESGPLSVLAPPDGVGRYTDSATVNVSTDDALEHHASWRVHQGTIDEQRFPVLEVELARAALVADTVTTTAVLDAIVGDGVDVEDPGPGLPPDGIRAVLAGRSVELGSHTYRWRAVAQPAAAYDVIFTDYEHPDEEHRLSSEGSTVNGVHTAGTTTLSVATPVGPLWGIADGSYHIRIPETGEIMRVDNVTGASSPQSFTVVRAQRGTTAKALAGGETVELARPVVWGL